MRKTRSSLTFAVALTLLASLSAALLPGGTAWATSLSGAEGVFKVVKPPAPGARNRLALTKVVKPRRPQRHRWFWEEVSPRIGDADRDRITEITAFAASRMKSPKTTLLVRTIEETYRAEIAAAARGARISEALLAAVIAAESGGRITARSPKGAQGLAQLMPGTAARFGVKDAYDPAQNLRGAADYLAFLLDMFDDDMVLALAGYNAGENAVTRHKGVPPYNETRDYVPKVLNYYAAANKVECLFDTTLTSAPCVPLQFPD